MSKANAHAISKTRRLKPEVAIGAQIEELLRIRREAEQTAAALIDLLDQRQPDQDLEEDDPAEPSLGSVETVDQTRWAAGGCGDWEDEHDGREPDDDHEEEPDLEIEHEGGDDTYAI